MSHPGTIGGLCARILDGREPRTSATSRRCCAPATRRRSCSPPPASCARRHSGDAVFLYGFVYFSTYCRNECAFCFYRADNDESPRYRKTDRRGGRHLPRPRRPPASSCST